MKEALDKNEIISFNLLPVFKKIGGNESMFYSKDMHFNQRGHQLAGEAIVEFLINNFSSFLSIS